MNNKEPLISIIMATYNRAHLIRETLLSVQTQKYTEWECLIIDDGSIDQTKKVIKPILESDSRFKYHLRTNKYKKGLPGCRNMGLDLAQGEYFIFFDDDDIVHANNLKICAQILQKYNVDFCSYLKKPFSGEWNRQFEINEFTNTYDNIDVRNIEEILTGKIGLASCTVMWKRKCFDSIRFNEELMYAEEWECYSRIILSGFKGISINKILYFNRKHLKSNTGEFIMKDSLRRSSKVMAIKLVVCNLKVNNLLSGFLIKFFIQSSFALNSRDLLIFILERSGYNGATIFIYKFIYRLYPIFKPVFQLKSKF